MVKYLQLFYLKKNTFVRMGKRYKEAVQENAKLFRIAGNITLKLKCNVIIYQLNCKYFKMISSNGGRRGWDE